MNLRYDFFYLQEQDYIPILKMHYELFTKSFYGKAVELAIVFNPVDMPSEKETAEVAKIWSDVDSNYISAGVMSAEEVRDVRRSQDDSPYSALADEMEGAPDEELNQAADEALDWKGDFDESKVNREHGRFAKKVDNSKVEQEVKTPRYVERKPQIVPVRESLKNKRIADSEYAIIHANLNERYANRPFPKSGYTLSRTSNYVYTVKIIEYDKYKPISRKEIP